VGLPQPSVLGVADPSYPIARSVRFARNQFPDVPNLRSITSPLLRLARRLSKPNSLHARGAELPWRKGTSGPEADCFGGR